MYTHWFRTLSNRAERAERELRRARIATRNLRRRVQELELLCEGLWDLLQEHAPLGEPDLARAIERRREARLDDRARTCPACSRPNGRGARDCKYCIAPLGAE